LTMVPGPRVIKAGNRGPFTLDGTRSFLVGQKRIAVIDPGPDVAEHVRALSRALERAAEVRILLTHGHGDHAGGAGALAHALNASVFGPPSAGFLPLEDGEEIPTDEGDLVSLATPGHTTDHLAYFWPRTRALFAGDLVLGRVATTWLGEYPGCVADYLASLERVMDLTPDTLYPAHGPPVRTVRETLEEHLPQSDLPSARPRCRCAHATQPRSPIRYQRLSRRRNPASQRFPGHSSRQLGS